MNEWKKEKPGAKPDGLVGRVTHSQAGGVGLEIILHRLDATDLRADLFLAKLPRDLVMNEPPPQRQDFNIRGAGLPNLTFRQPIWSSAFYLHLLLRQRIMRFCS